MKFDRQSQIKDAVGSIMYLAPEMIKKDLYNEKCDIWSLGVIMYTMLSGQPPFIGKNDQEFFDLIQNKSLTF